MRAYFLFAAAISAAALLSGCDDNPVERYGTGLVDTYKSTGAAADRAGVSLLENSIRAFKAANGRYPGSLEELSRSAGVSLDPEKYDYDPESGRISLR